VVAKQLKLSDVHHLIASIGQGDTPVLTVLRALHPELEAPQEPAKAPSAFERLVDRMRGNGKGVRIQGRRRADGAVRAVLPPVPGDPVVGYVTRGPRGEHPSRRLPEPAPARARAGAAAGDRLAGDGGESASPCASPSRATTAAGSTPTWLRP
jgi:GTP pyrophosphokinase